MTWPPVISFNPSVKTSVTNLLPVINGGRAKCRGSPRANPNAPSANACSSSHCGADKTSGNWGKSIPKYAASSVATISSLMPLPIR